MSLSQATTSDFRTWLKWLPIEPLVLPTLARFLYRPLAEPQSYRILPRLIEQSDTVYEIGAYLGGGTLLLSCLAKAVFTFEAHPLHYKVIRAVLARHDTVNVRLYNCAVSDSEGERNLFVDGPFERDITASLIQHRRKRRKIRVKSKTLDSLISVLPKPQVLVVDAEGAEVAILKGGIMALQSLRAAVIETHPVEGHHTREPIEDILNQSGLKTFAVAGDTPRTPTIVALRDFDQFRDGWILRWQAAAAKGA